MAKQIVARLDVTVAIEDGLGAAAPIAKIKTAMLKAARALAAAAGRRRRQPAEHLMARNLQEDARWEFESFLYW